MPVGSQDGAYVTAASRERSTAKWKRSVMANAPVCGAGGVRYNGGLALAAAYPGCLGQRRLGALTPGRFPLRRFSPKLSSHYRIYIEVSTIIFVTPQTSSLILVAMMMAKRRGRPSSGLRAGEKVRE